MPSGTHFQIQRIDSLTSIRGVAALVVLFLHVAQTFNFELTFFNLFKNGWLGVDLFFVLSGFILAHVYHQSEPTQKTFISFYKQFIINRLARIYPLHLCTLLFTLGLVIFLPGFYERYPKYFSDISFISNLLLIQNWGFIDISWNTVSWSISAEFFMYLLFPFFLISRSIFNKVEYTVIIILVLLLAHYLIIFSFGWSNYGGMSLGGMVRVFFEFLIGFHIYFLRKGFHIAFKDHTNVSLCILCILILVSFFVEKAWILFVPTISLFILHLSLFKTKLSNYFEKKPFTYLGEISFSLYMWHWLIIQVFNWSVSTKLLSAENSLQNHFYAIALCTISIAMAHISLKSIEIPSRKLIRRLAKPNRL